MRAPYLSTCYKRKRHKQDDDKEEEKDTKQAGGGEEVGVGKGSTAGQTRRQRRHYYCRLTSTKTAPQYYRPTSTVLGTQQPCSYTCSRQL